MNAFERLNRWARNSVTLKLVIIGFLILMLLIPTSFVDGLIRDRTRLRDQAQLEVASKWGLQQTLGGPVISVPYSYPVRSADGKTTTTQSGVAHFLPGEIDIEGEMVPEERYRGIYVVVLYNTKLRIRGNFSGFNVAALPVAPQFLNWERATLNIGISDMTGVNARIPLTLGDSLLNLGPGTSTGEVFTSGASAPVTLTGRETGLSFSYDLDLNGSSALYFRPFGERTTVRLTGSWANPSFDGTFLPRERAVTAEGYAAEWEVLQLNRNYPQQGIGNFLPQDGNVDYYASSLDGDRYSGSNAGDRFGVRLLLPVDEYQKTYRSTNFAALFIIITFLTFFFIEVLNRRRVHPIQYLLVGAAIILFYILLLSISEHWRFNAAYWVSAAATVALITTYSYFVVRSVKLTGLIAAVLTVLYIFFFSLLQLQDYALLIGALGLFLILATIMYLTRNVDWYNLNRE